MPFAVNVVINLSTMPETVLNWKLPNVKESKTLLHGFWIPESLSVELGFKIPKPRIPDFTREISRIRIPQAKFPGFQNPDSLHPR